MAHDHGEFEPTPFSAENMDARRIVDDEKRLFAAHCQMARKGHPSQFGVTLRARFSAPFIVDQKGASRVLTMGIDTVGMLPVLPRETMTHLTTVKTTGNEEGRSDETVRFHRMADGSAWRSSPPYAEDMPDDLDSFRADVLVWAQGQFEAGVSDMAQSQMFDRIAFSRLEHSIRRGIDEVFDNFVYLPGYGRGDFVSKSAAPRLACAHYSNSISDVVLKLQRPSDDLTRHWTGILSSLPAELALTGSRIRWTVMNAVAGSARHDIDQPFFEGWEDSVFRKGMLIRRDQNDFSDIKASESALFVRAVRAMAKDILAFHRSGEILFSGDTISTCDVFASPNSDIDQPYWEGAVDTLRELLEEDGTAMTAFLDRAGWTLAPSPMIFVKAKTNLFLGNDLSHGLYEAAPAVTNSGNKGPKR